MNKALSAIFALFLLANAATAQDDGAKLAKSAGKALQSYNVDPTGNKEKLDEAKDKIDRAMQTPEAQALQSAWQIRGEIYGTINNRDMVKQQLDPKAPLSTENPALTAYESFKKAYELAQKKYEKGDAIKGILDNLQPSMLNIGGMKYEAKEYDKAFASFKGALESHDVLKTAGEKSYFDDKTQLETYTYYTAICARLAGKGAESMPFLESLYKGGSAKSEVYEEYYNALLESGKTEEAEKVLTEGRSKFPDDSGLLFAEINSYLKKGKLNELTGRLEQAIAKEPSNIGLYVTLGSVYDNLYQKALEAKDDAATTKNFDEAKKWYTSAIGKDPKNVDANYSLGALYYNKAAIRTKELNAMPEDYSAAGIKKYEAMKNEIMALFDQSLPHFQKAESLDPNDLNTLIALKEIYTRKEDDLAIEFKKRLDNANSGQKNASSYFKN